MALFVDKAKIFVKSGNGGNGCVAFHREKYVQHGGPDGGDGGCGGDIVFLSDVNMHTLMDFRYRRKFFAEPGQDGAGNNCTGKTGAPMVIKMPVGTIVRDVQTGRVVADLDTPGKEYIYEKGGRGGWGNAHFATPTRQAPNFAKPGEKKEAKELELELKSIADVGLIGYPNVGKSTILSVVTAAKPKIANYHFTTLTPNLGIVKEYGQDYVMADIPGLVEGAHTGTGLGHAFLRHVERTRLLVHVLDIAGSEGRDPIEDYERINEELSQYGRLCERPQIIAANKIDLTGAEENLERLRAHVGEGVPVFAVSAATHQGFKPLLQEIARLLPTLEAPELYDEDEELYIDEQSGEDQNAFEISAEDGVFFVDGKAAQRLIDSVNFSDMESLNWFHAMLRRLGVIDRLRDAGAKDGDTVVFVDMEFDFVE